MASDSDLIRREKIGMGQSNFLAARELEQHRNVVLGNAAAGAATGAIALPAGHARPVNADEACNGRWAAELAND